MRNYKFIYLFILSLCSSMLNSQTITEPQMAEGFYQEGKVYVVIVILSMVLVGIAFYLISIERKLKRLEKLVKEKQPEKNSTL